MGRVTQKVARVMVISRDRLAAGGLARLVDGRHVTGVTSNPWQEQCLTRHAYYGYD
jgi:hypothetical protein